MKFKLFSLIIFSVLFLGVISAQELEVSPGITPDSPFYGLDIAIDNLRLRLFNDPETGLMIAEERLAEIKVMLQENKTSYIPNLLQLREQAMNRSRERIQTQEQQQRFGNRSLVQEQVMNNFNKTGLSEQLKLQIQNTIQSEQEARERVNQLNMTNGRR